VAKSDRISVVRPVETATVSGAKLSGERERIYRSACPSLREKLDWVIEWIKDEARHSLMRRYDLGLVIKEIFDDQKAGGSIYGKKALAKISRFTGEDPQLSRLAMRLVTCFTREQLEELSRTVMSDRVTPLSYSHIRQLLIIDNPSARKTALDKTVKHCWTSGELGAYIQDMYNPDRPRSSAGRPPAIPRTLDGLIVQQSQIVGELESRCEKVWMHEDHSISAKVDGLDTTSYTEELAKKVYKLWQDQERVVEQLTGLAAATKVQFTRIRSVLDARGTPKKCTSSGVTMRTISDRPSKKKGELIPALSDEE